MTAAGRPPTRHRVEAALRAARLMDRPGNDPAALAAAFRLALTDGTHPARSLADGQALLVGAGLALEGPAGTAPTPRLAAVARLGDEDAIRVLTRLLALAHRPEDDPELRARIGADGEDAVVLACRGELAALGESTLADGVQRVSLIDDSFGFDVIAPTVSGGDRRLEVKTCSSDGRGPLRVYLTRNEHDAGVADPANWALAVCLHDGTRAEPLGWCRAGSLRPYLPDDGGGRWTEAVMSLPPALLHAGLPPAV